MFKTALPLIALLLGATVTTQSLALTDPTRPSSFRAQARQESLRLESILFSDTRKVAVINGKALAQGDSIGSATVTAINRNSVKLKRSGKVLVLEIQHPSIRQEK